MPHSVTRSSPLPCGTHFSLPASFTVEASLVMPPVLLTLLLILFLCAHVHNRAVLTASACEQAVSGREQEIEVLFLENEVTCERNSDKKKRVVSFRLLTVPYLTERQWEESVRAVYDISDPAGFLHKLAAGKELLSGTSDNE